MLSPPTQVTVWPFVTRTVSGSNASSAVFTDGPSALAAGAADAASSEVPQAADRSSVENAAATTSVGPVRQEVFTTRRSRPEPERIGPRQMSNVTASGT